jgi:hypothetical protein
MVFRSAALALVLASLPACHLRREVTTSDLRGAAAAAGVSVPAPAVEDLAWLEGAWRGEGLDGVVDEVWSAPVDGAMVGHFRFTKDGTVGFYELMTLGPIGADGRFGMKVKHFGPDLGGWEEKDGWVAFPFLERVDERFHFDGLTIERVAADRVEISVRIRGRDGTERTEVFRYRRLR